MEAWKHFCTITQHKMIVMKSCFQVGLYKQGLLHDLSKYGLAEFPVGAKYYQGTRSPNNAEREDRGYSSAWLHHKGRNKHHYEYWLDYSMEGEQIMGGMKMPKNYVVEMFLDRVAASKTYQKERYTNQAPLVYYSHGNASELLHPNTREILEKLLHMLAEQGERKTFAYIRNVILK
ncbi:MAG: DUF5662 family protein [Lachnospiraceae bacterium]